MKERWQVIPDTKACYEASTLGRIRRAAPARNSFVGKVLVPNTRGAGYLYVCLSCNGTAKKHNVHVLVAKTFIGPCPDGKQVNHKDTVKKNCRLRNLEYVTPKGNKRHAGLFGLNRGPGKLTPVQVRRIRALSTFFSRAELGRRYNIDESSILGIVRNESYRWVA